MKQEITRFAPSPTGHLHLGGARTALFAWLHAKASNGKFLIRFEDTDKERSKDEYVKSILSSLLWLGIEPDEPPIFQSKKETIHQKAALQLLKSGLAYSCDCSPEQLKSMREEQIKKQIQPKYDGFNRNNNLPHKQGNVIRFKMSQTGTTSFEDKILGSISVQNKELDDFIILRSDDSPTYNFCAAIDDIDMKITHVLRGEDHVSNTATQIQLFDELNAEIPSFGHHSLMVHKDGSRMSKRTGSMSLRDIRDAGIEAITLVNYCARIGTSDAVEAYQDTSDLIKNYDLSKISRSPARYSYEEIELLNKKILQNKTFASVKTDLSKLGINDEIAEKFWNIIRSNINSISESQKWWDIINKDIRSDLELEDSNFFSIAYDSLPQEPWDDTTWLSWTSEVSKKTSRKGRELYLPLRLAITGENSGPELASFLLLLGRGKVTERLEFHIK